jgi:hypothetical protein
MGGLKSILIHTFFVDFFGWEMFISFAQHFGGLPTPGR